MGKGQLREISRLSAAKSFTRFLRQSCDPPAAYMSFWAHTVAMKTYKPQKVALLLSALALAIAWAIVMNIAIVISETMMKTLELIVELAAISP